MLAYQRRGKSRQSQRLWRHSRANRSRRGVTLIEMMVAITITLIMIVALTQAFQSISESVSDSRAMITLTEATRKTAMTLQRDLDGLTVPARPWPEAASGLGYLEITEGYGSDMNPQPTNNGSTTLTVDQQSFLHLLGDIDDVVMFTSRAKDEPFVGRIQQKYLQGLPNDTTAARQAHVAIDSPLAEIVWWTSFDSFSDLDGDSFQSTTEVDATADGGRVLELEKNETAVVRRRALLIRPDLNGVSSGHLDILLHPRTTGGTSRQILSDFLANNDISVHAKAVVNSSGNTEYYLAANTLADLTRRENRVGHMMCNNVGAYVPMLNTSSAWVAGNFRLNRNSPPFLYTSRYTNTAVVNATSENKQSTSQYTTFINGSNASDVVTGEDIMIGNVLAFDLKVFDPQAPILSVQISGGTPVALARTTRLDATGTRITFPAVNATYPFTDAEGRIINSIGQGEFVDLNYSLNTTIGGSNLSLFSGEHANDTSLAETILWAISEPATNHSATHAAYTYDTWSWDYERDGINQNAGVNTTADEGTNGLDDDDDNGVDDVAERETSPPYPYPLRGVQVTIRVHDVSTRQLRQFSVVSDFTPE